MVSKKQAKDMLRGGGQRVFTEAKAEIYDRAGYRDDGTPKLDRQTGAGMKTRVRQLLDPRLDLTDTQRAVGNCYGAYSQEILSGGRGRDFLREFVDSSEAGGGHSETHAHKSMMISCANDRLREMPPFTYPRAKTRNSVQGRHDRVTALQLASTVCTHQKTLTQVAMGAGWYRIPVKDGKWGRITVPNRQRMALAQALRDTLDAIKGAWDDQGYAVPYGAFTVVTR